jgi:hypothetical protein
LAAAIANVVQDTAISTQWITDLWSNATFLTELANNVTISNHETRITTNEGNILANQASITNNTILIAANTAAIGALGNGHRLTDIAMGYMGFEAPAGGKAPAAMFNGAAGSGALSGGGEYLVLDNATSGVERDWTVITSSGSPVTFTTTRPNRFVRIAGLPANSYLDIEWSCTNGGTAVANQDVGADAWVTWDPTGAPTQVRWLTCLSHNVGVGDNVNTTMVGRIVRDAVEDTCDLQIDPVYGVAGVPAAGVMGAFGTLTIKVYAP